MVQIVLILPLIQNDIVLHNTDSLLLLLRNIKHF